MPEWEGGSNRTKKKDMVFNVKATAASIIRNEAVSSGKAIVERVEKMKALRPYPAKGKPVAVPR